MYKVYNINTRKRCKICSKLPIKTPERRHVIDVVLVSLLLTLQNIIRILVTLGCLLSRKVRWAVRSDSFCPKWGILQIRMDQRGEPHQNEFDYFQIERWMLQTKWEKKIKDGVLCLVSTFLSWDLVLKLSKKVHFMQFCADLSKKSMSLKAISIYASESSYHTLSEYGMCYSGLIHRSWDISD